MSKEKLLNRKERRAIQFHPFALNRIMYQPLSANFYTSAAPIDDTHCWVFASMAYDRKAFIHQEIMDFLMYEDNFYSDDLMLTH